jgi:hypothetical protein
LLQAAAAAAAGLSAVTIAESHRSTAGGYAVPMPPSCSALDMARRGSAHSIFLFVGPFTLTVLTKQILDFTHSVYISITSL